jgi:hypothetical protein
MAATKRKSSPHERTRFTGERLTRAIKAAIKAGVSVRRAVIGRDNSIELSFGPIEAVPANGKGDEADKWIEDYARRHEGS